MKPSGPVRWAGASPIGSKEIKYRSNDATQTDGKRDVTASLSTSSPIGNVRRQTVETHYRDAAITTDAQKTGLSPLSDFF
jgi:hypothetical protein